MRPLRAIKLVLAAILVVLVLVELWVSNRPRSARGSRAPADTTCIASHVGIPCR